MAKRHVDTMSVAGATLMALVLLPAAWFVVAMTAVQLGGRLGLAKDAAEDLIRVAWFVGAWLGGLLGLWIAGVLVRSAPVRTVFLAFAGFVTAMFLMALAGYWFGGGFTEGVFIGGMLAQYALVLAGAWMGWRLAARAQGGH